MNQPSPPSINAVIPTLNAADQLPHALAPLIRSKLVSRIIVADGGSSDLTRDIAQKAGAHFLPAPRGRAAQMNLAAKHADAEWILFLHADTQLLNNWEKHTQNFILNTKNNAPRAACFSFALNDTKRRARLLEALVSLRCSLLALPYGDQGLLMPRQFFFLLGGFPNFPIMEDVHLIRRIGRKRLYRLPATARTSARRYQNGYLRRAALNTLCLALYFLKIPTTFIAKLYG